MNKDLYEIYRACRLCGVGAGYKMPIIQSIIDVNEEVELKQKIKECVQIEVSLQDRMPPLICELCVDKIHDFFEFRKMCLDINRTTRLRLGLPPEDLEPQKILGMMKRLNSDSEDGEPLSSHQVTRKPRPKSKKINKEDDIKKETEPIVVASRSPSPFDGRRRATRQNRVNTPLFELEFQGLETKLKSQAGPKTMKNREKLEDSMNDEPEEMSLLLPRQKRPREVILEMPVKKARLSEPIKPEKTPKPGPKSSKETPKPAQKSKAAPKSKKVEIPIEKPQKPETNSKTKKTEAQETASKKKTESKTKTATPKTKSKSETAAEPKLKKSENSTPNTKGKITTPGPKSRTSRQRGPSPAPAGAPPQAGAPPPDGAPPPAKWYACDICGARIRAASALISHLKTHAPTYTQEKLACNPCELWFPTSELASSHHKRHIKFSEPYTCNKCYADFKTTADYDTHFTRGLCVATYEVPDARCEVCWRTFPTDRLLDDHRCAGEAGRPGGKCDRCKRFYVSLKGLMAHETRCSVKKKEELQPVTKEPPSSTPSLPPSSTPSLPPSSTPSLPPVQVRIVRCDNILKDVDGRYHVRGLPKKFGLDPKCTYPYLTSVKKEPVFDHMVSIGDQLKQEYLQNNANDVTHWDSDESDDDTNKSTDSLFTISLKKLFSPKCLGTLPKKVKSIDNVKSENFDSTIDDFDDVNSNINDLIDTMDKSNYNEDSEVGSNDNSNGNTESVENIESAKSNIVATGNTDEELKEVNNIIEENVTIDEKSNNDMITGINAENLNSEDLNLKKIKTNQSIEQNVNIQESDDTKVNEDSEITNYNQTEPMKDSEPKSPKFCSEYTKTNESTNDNDQNESTNDIGQNESTNDIGQNNEKHCTSPKVDQIDNKTIETNESISHKNARTEQTESQNMDIEEKVTDFDINNLNNCNDVEMREATENPTLRNIENDDDLTNDSKSTNISDRTECTDTKSNSGSIHKIDDKLNEHEDSTNYDINNLNNCNDVEMSEATGNPILRNIENDDDLTNDSKSTNISDRTECTDAKSNSGSIHKIDDKLNEHEDSNDYETNERLNDDPTYTENESHNDSTYTTNDAANDRNVNDDFSQLKDDTQSSTKSYPQIDFDLDMLTKNNEENAEPNFKDSKESLITDSDLFGTEDVQSIDKFNINNLDDEDKIFMAELDAQIGECQAAGINSVRNVTGENSKAFGENSKAVGENSKAVGENNSLGGNNDLFGRNGGLGNNSDNKGNDSKQNDLGSLDLDTISDEEFNFDN